MKNFPRRSWAFWVLVAQEVRQKRVRSGDLQAVRIICMDVDKKFHLLRRKANEQKRKDRKSSG